MEQKPSSQKRPPLCPVNGCDGQRLCLKTQSDKLAPECVFAIGDRAQKKYDERERLDIAEMLEQIFIENEKDVLRDAKGNIVTNRRRFLSVMMKFTIFSAGRKLPPESQPTTNDDTEEQETDPMDKVSLNRHHECVAKHKARCYHAQMLHAFQVAMQSDSDFNAKQRAILGLTWEFLHRQLKAHLHEEHEDDRLKINYAEVAEALRARYREMTGVSESYVRKELCRIRKKLMTLVATLDAK